MKNLILFLLILTSLSACRLEDKKSHEKLKIVTTTGIIFDGVQAIVGDSAYVDFIMGPGTDPHVYKPTSTDVELLDEADVIVMNGLHLEGKMAEMLNKYGQEKPVIRISDGIAEKHLLKVADFEDAYDPHIWFDLTIWEKGLQHFTEEISSIDSTNKVFYQQNFERYKNQMREADDFIASELAKIPENKRVLITSHDAFNYFGRKYSIDVRGIQGISTLSEVGLKEISDMVNFVVDNQITAIFTETATSDKTAKSIQDGAKEKGHEVAIDGPLYADALGEPHEPAGTYVGMIKANVEMIVNGLTQP